MGHRSCVPGPPWAVYSVGEAVLVSAVGPGEAPKSTEKSWFLNDSHLISNLSTVCTELSIVWGFSLSLCSFFEFEVPGSHWNVSEAEAGFDRLSAQLKTAIFKQFSKISLFWCVFRSHWEAFGLPICTMRFAGLHPSLLPLLSLSCCWETGCLFLASTITAWQLQSSHHLVSNVPGAPVARLHCTGQKCSLSTEGRSQVGSDQSPHTRTVFSPRPCSMSSSQTNPSSGKIRLFSVPASPSFATRFLLFQTKAALCEGVCRVLHKYLIFSNLPSALPVSSWVETALFALASNRILFWKVMQKSDYLWIWALFCMSAFQGNCRFIFSSSPRIMLPVGAW